MPLSFLYKLFMTKKSNPDKKFFMSSDWMNRNRSKMSRNKERYVSKGR